MKGLLTFVLVIALILGVSATITFPTPPALAPVPINIPAFSPINVPALIPAISPSPDAPVAVPINIPALIPAFSPSPAVGPIDVPALFPAIPPFTPTPGTAPINVPALIPAVGPAIGPAIPAIGPAIGPAVAPFTPTPGTAPINIPALIPAIGPAIGPAVGPAIGPAAGPVPQVPQPTPLQTPSNSTTASVVCLWGGMQVETPAGAKLLRDVEVGDFVLTDGVMEPVLFSGLHRTEDGQRSNEIKTTFVEITLSGGSKILMTPLHYALTSAGEVLAREVKVDDIIGKERVVSTSLVEEIGVYNPQTPSREIQVNGVLVTTKSKIDPVPELLPAGLVVASALHAILPTASYNSFVNGLSRYLFEPIYYGEYSSGEMSFALVAAVVATRSLLKLK